MNSSFTQPEILKQIGPARIARFFQDFAEDLKIANLVPPVPDSDPDNYFTAVAAFFASPALPARMSPVMLALGRLAAPENSDSLRSAIRRYIPCISFPFDAAPLDRALELWFFSQETALALAASCPPLPTAVPAGGS